MLEKLSGQELPWSRYGETLRSFAQELFDLIDAEPFLSAGLEEKTEKLVPGTEGTGSAPTAAGLEGVRQRMPEWLKEVMTPDEWVESVYRVHNIPQFYQGVAVLMDRPLLAGEDADPEIVARRLVRLKRDLRGVARWFEATPVRVGVWSQKLEDAYRVHGFRVVRITRDGRDPMRDPIPPELLLLAVVRAVASGEEIFAVNVADYRRLRGRTYQEIHNTLANLFA